MVNLITRPTIEPKSIEFLQLYTSSTSVPVWYFTFNKMKTLLHWTTISSSITIDQCQPVWVSNVGNGINTQGVILILVLHYNRYNCYVYDLNTFITNSCRQTHNFSDPGFIVGWQKNLLAGNATISRPSGKSPNCRY